MITLFATKLSAHGQRVEMLLKALGLGFSYEHTPREERQTPDFLTLNPFGQIPVLQDGDLAIADSNAILVYLASKYDSSRIWLPNAPERAAAVQKWLSVAAGEIAHGPGLARGIKRFGLPGELADAQRRAVGILNAMDRHLTDRRWLADPTGTGSANTPPTIADLACYGYVSTAPEGDVAIEPHQNVRRWLHQVEAEPYFVPIPTVPTQ